MGTLYGPLITNLESTVLLPYKKRILRIIGGDNPRATTTRFQETKIMRFHNLNRYFTGIFVYKFMNNLLPKSFVNYFVKTADTHKYNTRAAGGWSAQYARTNYRKFALGCRGPVIWNAIPPTFQPLRLFISSWKAHINKLYL